MNVNDRDFLIDYENCIGFVVFGCPFKDQTYDVFDSNHLGTAIRSVVCEYGGQTSDPSLVRLEGSQNVPFDPDGMSGGPVFAIVKEGLEFKVKFAGLVTRSNGKIFHVVRALAALGLVRFLVI